MHSFLCFSKIGFLHDIDLYLGSLSLEICDFDSKQLSLPVAISACRAAPMGANPLGHTFKPLTLYDISIYTIYFSHPEGDYVIMDNLRTHHCNFVGELIRAKGAIPLYLPPYSPDLNPIEKMWAKMKSILRKWRIRIKDKLITAIPQALNLVTPSDCQGWFTCAGY